MRVERGVFGNGFNVDVRIFCFNFFDSFDRSKDANEENSGGVDLNKT